jgi:hypothetical protein
MYVRPSSSSAAAEPIDWTARLASMSVVKAVTIDTLAASSTPSTTPIPSTARDDRLSDLLPIDSHTDHVIRVSSDSSDIDDWSENHVPTYNYRSDGSYAPTQTTYRTAGRRDQSHDFDATKSAKVKIYSPDDPKGKGKVRDNSFKRNQSRNPKARAEEKIEIIEDRPKAQTTSRKDIFKEMGNAFMSFGHLLARGWSFKTDSTAAERAEHKSAKKLGCSYSKKLPVPLVSDDDNEVFHVAKCGLPVIHGTAYCKHHYDLTEAKKASLNIALSK